MFSLLLFPHVDDVLVSFASHPPLRIPTGNFVFRLNSIPPTVGITHFMQDIFARMTEAGTFFCLVVLLECGMWCVSVCVLIVGRQCLPRQCDCFNGCLEFIFTLCE